MTRSLKVGAVMYDPKVSVIWEIIRDFFDAQNSPIDVTFYPTYEAQNDGLLSGAIDIAWNSPLAWLDAQRRSYDILKSARVRRETYVGPWLPEPLLTGPDASEAVLVDESVGSAMLLIMEELSPPERVAFVLHG